MKYSIQQISAEETYLVRLPVLRPGKPLESCVFDGDTLKTTIHIGLFSKEKLLGVCSFFKTSNPLFAVKSQYQLRGMAVLKAHQQHGLGTMLLAHGENLLKKSHANMVWCNARETAIGFYKKNGYTTQGKPFNIPGVGIHYAMHKTLKTFTLK